MKTILPFIIQRQIFPGDWDIFLGFFPESIWAVCQFPKAALNNQNFTFTPPPPYGYFFEIAHCLIIIHYFKTVNCYSCACLLYACLGGILSHLTYGGPSENRNFTPKVSSSFCRKTQKYRKRLKILKKGTRFRKNF